MQRMILIGIVLVALLVGGYAIFRNTTAEPPAHGDDLQAFSDGAVLISYPQEYMLASRGEDSIGESAVPPCEAGYDYCIYYAGDAYAGTNFESAGFTITRRADIASEASCLSTQPTGYSNITPVTQRTDTYAAVAYGPIQQAGAGHYSTGVVYRLAFDGQCYEFETRIGQTQLANYPVGSVRAFSSADEERVRAELRAMLDGLRRTDGGAVAFPTI